MEIKISEDIKKIIEEQGKDFRVRSICSFRPALVPVEESEPKGTDVKVKIGKQILYISATQINDFGLKEVNADMLCSTCFITDKAKKSIK
jgi:hypothetical protein